MKGRATLWSAPLLVLLSVSVGVAAASAAKAPAHFGFFFEDFNADGRYVIACVGDSNTQTLSARSWCDRLPDTIGDPRLEVVNLAQMGTRSFGETGRNGPLQLITALRDPQVDAVVLSFGTNDLHIPGKTPEEIVGHFRELRSWTGRAGRSFFVATTPPYVGREELRFNDRNPPPCVTGTCFNQRIDRLNELVWASFPPSEVIEFHRNYPRERFSEDGIHVDAEGHALRSKRAAYMLHGPVRCDAKRQCRPPRFCMDGTESEALERITGKKFGDLRGMIPAGTCVTRERLREAADIGSELSQTEWKIRVDTEVQKRSIGKEFECRESDECREAGKCASVAIHGSPGEFHCRPTWKEHCEESAACRDHGACRLENNLCVR